MQWMHIKTLDEVTFRCGGGLDWERKYLESRDLCIVENLSLVLLGTCAFPYSCVARTGVFYLLTYLSGWD